MRENWQNKYKNNNKNKNYIVIVAKTVNVIHDYRQLIFTKVPYVMEPTTPGTEDVTMHKASKEEQKGNMKKRK